MSVRQLFPALTHLMLAAVVVGGGAASYAVAIVVVSVVVALLFVGVVDGVAGGEAKHIHF